MLKIFFNCFCIKSAVCSIRFLAVRIRRIRVAIGPSIGFLIFTFAFTVNSNKLPLPMLELEYLEFTIEIPLFVVFQKLSILYRFKFGIFAIFSTKIQIYSKQF